MTMLGLKFKTLIKDIWKSTNRNQSLDYVVL